MTRRGGPNRPLLLTALGAAADQPVVRRSVAAGVNGRSNRPGSDLTTDVAQWRGQ